MKKMNFLMVGIAVGAMVMALTWSGRAEAAYFRFWRGQKKSGLSTEALRDGLNASLLPATGALASTTARLKSYQPVLMPLDLVDSAARGTLPEEVALVEYESVESYQAYRSTPEGRAYGDLHWDLFEREGSGSLVPQRYAGQVELEKAYNVINAPIDWSEGHARFRVFLRGGSFSDESYLDSIEDHIEHVLTHSPSAMFLLVAQDYVMEYVLFDDANSARRAERTAIDIITERGPTPVFLDDLAEITAQMEMSTPVRRGTELNFGEAISYPAVP